MFKLTKFFILILYVTCLKVSAEPSLDETLGFMSNIIESNASRSDGYIATITGKNDAHCQVAYTNHPMYNSINIDDKKISFDYDFPSNMMDEIPWVEQSSLPRIVENNKCNGGGGTSFGTPEPDSSILGKVSGYLYDVEDTVTSEADDIKDGFFNYFSSSNKKMKDILPSDYLGYYEGYYHRNIVFKSNIDISNLNPSSIVNTDYGIFLNTTNKDKSIEISLFKPSCILNRKDTQNDIGVFKLVNGPELKIDSVSFHVKEEYKAKFKKALIHAIKLCGGKKDLF